MNPKHRKILSDNCDDLANALSLDCLRNDLSESLIFTQDMLDDILTEKDLISFLQTRGPAAFENFVKILEHGGYKNALNILENAAKRKSDIFYKMSSSPLGLCLIINNKKFPGDLYRFGSEQDVESLKKVFKMMNFDVRVEEDLESHEMLQKVEEFANSTEFKVVDSCILIIMSHGNSINKEDDVIYGIDRKEKREYVFKNKIIESFRNRDNFLQEKPKVLFFLCCRGSQTSYGVECNASKMTTDSTLPTYSDLLFIHCTLPGHEAVRNTEKGSWFCQTFVKILEDNYLEYDLRSIINKVNEKMVSQTSEFGKKQVAHCQDYGLRKNIMLCPVKEI